MVMVSSWDVGFKRSSFECTAKNWDHGGPIDRFAGPEPASLLTSEMEFVADCKTNHSSETKPEHHPSKEHHASSFAFVLKLSIA
jgi:hypothetical protein